MKSRIVFLSVFVAVLVSGCLVKSIHPFYKEKDVVFKKELIGIWSDQDNGKWIISQVKKNDTPANYYSVILENEGGVSKFATHLFKLNNQWFVDFLPEELSEPDITAYHLVKTHSLAKIEFSGDQIKIKWFNEMWLADLFKNNKIRISHETIKGNDQDESYVLTASTEELQKFIIKYGDDPNAFIDDQDPESKNRKEVFCYSLKRIRK